ncbi:hypothetical protein BaRGS_00022311 [Batillaria attramentaria]|uniref:Uncharacterized protein n=1 Tax=Batillaria attramentaria TaxID=370345 RepID=A0ABD0KH29_9CAEN
MAVRTGRHSFSSRYSSRYQHESESVSQAMDAPSLAVSDILSRIGVFTSQGWKVQTTTDDQRVRGSCNYFLNESASRKAH